MDIKNSEKVMNLLKMRSNVENLITYLNEHDDCTVIVSAKSKDTQGRFLFLDAQGIDEVVGLLNDMEARFDKELKKM